MLLFPVRTAVLSKPIQTDYFELCFSGPIVEGAIRGYQQVLGHFLYVTPFLDCRW